MFSVTAQVFVQISRTSLVYFESPCSAWYLKLAKEIEKQNLNYSEQMHTFLSPPS